MLEHNLYRGVRKDNGELVYGSLLKANEGRCFIIPEFCATEHVNSPHIWVEEDLSESACPATICGLPCYEVIPETVGIYTHLNDKNGVKLFTGDKVNVKTQAYFFPDMLVAFDEHNLRFIMECKNGHRYPLDWSWKYELCNNTEVNESEGESDA